MDAQERKQSRKTIIDLKENNLFLFLISLTENSIKLWG